MKGRDVTSSSTFAGSSEESETRSGATRPADTRQRIIDAVVESVTQVGIHRTTGKEIAHRSGLTWGAVQHHFGDKDGIFDAVLDSSLEAFTGYLEGLPPPEAPLEERIDAFVDATWRHFKSPLAASAIEIRLATMRPEDGPYQRGRSDDRLATAWSQTWRKSLGLDGQPESRILQLSLMTTSYLSGLATMTRLSPLPEAAVQDQIDLLKRILTHQLSSL